MSNSQVNELVFAACVDTKPAPIVVPPAPLPVAPKAPARKFPIGALMPFEIYSPADIGNSERFFDLKGDGFKYVPEASAWRSYRDGLWISSKGAARRAMLDTIKQMGKEVIQAKNAAGTLDENAARAFAAREKFYEQSCTDHALNAALNVAACTIELEEPAANFDMSPMLFNAPNGTFNVETGVLQPHNGADLFTKMGKVAVGPEDAQCPKFLGFMDWMTGGRPELREFMLTALGYSLTASVRERKAFMLKGAGNNGKGVLTKLMAECAGLGEFMSVLPFSVMQAKPFDNAIPVELATSAGKRIIFINEADKGQWFNEPVFKEWVSGDPQMARFMRQDPFTFFPVAKFWFCTNHPILIRSNDDAMWERLLVIPCDARVTGNSVNTNLLAELLEEKEAIMRLLLTYAAKWAREGLKVPQCVVECTAKYRADMDEFAGFISESLERGEGYKMSTLAAFELYCEWATKSRIKASMKKSTFKAMMLERGFVEKHTNSGDVWLGVRAKQAKPAPDLNFKA